MARNSQSGQMAPVSDPSPFDRLLRIMANRAEIEQEQGGITGDSLSAILTAETEAEMWEADERGSLNAKLLDGCELEIRDFSVKFSPSDNDEITTIFVTSDGRKLYLMVEAVRISDAHQNNAVKLPKVGEVFTFNTSAPYVVAKLFWLQSHDLLPKHARFVAVPLGAGKTVVKLRDLPNRAVSGS